MPAHMIPPLPKDFDEKSNEGLVFRALKKLPDEYYVFHSVVINDFVNRKFVEREIDFVVVSRKRGILCIEAKNGTNIHYEDRTWYYSGGDKMKNGGPYNQAATAKYALKNKLKHHRDQTLSNIFYNCRMMHAVWFFGMSRASFEEKNNVSGLPEDAPMELTLFAEDLANPTTKINSIFNILIPIDEESTVTTNISEEAFKKLLEDFFCPEFRLIPSPTAKSLLIEEQMNQLLYEQYKLLDFLEDQPTAVINGAAGTGKTMLAIEKARNNSLEGEAVLFLCYNRLLCDHLINTNKNNPSKAYRRQFQNVDFMTISELAKQKTGNFQDFNGLMNWLLDCLDGLEEFKYQHVIVDEGQDFGLIDEQADLQQAETNCSIIDTIQEIIIDKGGTFYLFYDKYQMIQGSDKAKYKLPDCITNSDCRLSLHYNCRNTKEIATTSVTPLKDQKNRAIKPKTACNWYEPIKPIMHLASGDKKIIRGLQNVLDYYQKNKVKDVVILTPGKIDYSCIAEDLIKGENANKGYDIYQYNGVDYKVTTCRKFKGLEADAIVMIDLDKNSFADKRGLNFYVGTSRAKKFLDFIIRLAPQEYGAVVAELDSDAPQKRDAEKMKTILGEVFSADIDTI